MERPRSQADSPRADAAERKATAVNERLAVLIADLRQSADILEAISGSPEPDRQHFYAEAVRQAAQVRNRVIASTDTLAYLAYTEPDRVSIARLANFLGTSVNTFRAKLPQGASALERAKLPDGSAVPEQGNTTSDPY